MVTGREIYPFRNIQSRFVCLFFVFSRVYLATKKNDENKTKYAIKVINKQDIRKKNLTDQSNEKKNRIFFSHY